jgi:putative endonuclease
MYPQAYFVYILTNAKKTVLYVGVTNDLARRLQEHYDNRGNPQTFAGKYYCYYLVYWEMFKDVRYAIEREKEIKKWRREKKEALIGTLNPEWKFLNNEV